MKTLHDIGEDALISMLLENAPLPEPPDIGPGDDCAVIDAGGDALLLLKTDTIVEKIHFTPETAAFRIGWKATARAISDIAAMGGTPSHVLVSLALDPATPAEWANELYKGIGDCLRTHSATLAGGETSSVPAGAPAVITISATGRVSRERLILRSTAKPGDLLLVTGTLGGSLAGKHLDFSPRMAEAQWLVSHFKPTAMMDLSDGLAKDLPRLAAASHCGYILRRENLPLSDGCTTDQALGDGEDYELLLSISPHYYGELIDTWAEHFPHTPLTLIGALTRPGLGDEPISGGWDHFA